MLFNGMIGPINSNRKMIPKSLSYPILKAILNDESNKLGELISNLEDVNSAFHLYNKKLPDILSNHPTMLCLCCFFSSIECFNLIRDLGGKVKEEDDFGRNCFHFATAGGSLEMMRILDQSIVDNTNDRNSNVDSSSDDDEIYVGHNYLKKAFAALEDGNIYNKRDERGLTPMHYGAMFGRLDAIRYIYTKGAYLDKIHDFQGNRPIHLACLYGHTDVVKFFVENGVKIESDKYLNKLQPIHYACIGGYIDTIEYLISLKADINLMANSKTPIFYAARYGSLGAVKLLVKHGATFKFKRRKNSPIVEAALGGHADVINYFLQNGCDPNVYTSTGETPLMAAISGNNPEVVKLLIKNGAKINFEPFNRKKSSSKKLTEEEESSSEDENETKKLKRGHKKSKEKNERKKKMDLLDKEIIDINSYNMKDTTDLLIAASRKENIEIFKLILQNIDIKKYIESDEEITNRKRKVNKEIYELLLEEKKQEEMKRKKKIRSKIGFRRAFFPSEQSSDDDEDDENSESTKNEEEENEEEEKDEDKKIFRKLCNLGYYSFGNFDDANFYSDPNCGKRYQLFSNAVDFKSIELLKILIENKLIPKDTTKFYIRMANEGCADMINVMLDNDIPFNKSDYNLKNEVFNLGKIDILEKFRQKGLKLDINNDICFLSRIINTYDPELLIYVLDKIYVKDPESKPPIVKLKRKKRRSYFLGEYAYSYDDFAYKYLDNPTLMMDPVNTVLNKALQFPIGPNNSMLRRNLFSSNSSLNFEKTISENEENLIKILNILLDRGFKFNPKGVMFTIPPCVSLKEINLLFTLLKEIEKRKDSEKINFEKLRLGNIIHLLEEYDISEYKEFIDFLFDRNFSPKPKEGEQKSSQMKFYEEIDTSFSSALRTILLKNKYSDRISTVRRLSRYGIFTDSSDDDYFYDTDYADNNDDENNGDKKDEKENEMKENDKILQTELNLINYMLNHGTPILDRSLRLIEKIGHKTNNMELINLAFKNLILIDPNYKRERRYSIIDSDEHKTPLELACKRGYYEIAVDLISRGANINESGFKDYSSPLMFAMMSKNENLIHFLQSKNAQLPLNNPKCLPNLLKYRDRWLPGYRPRLFSQKGPTLYIGGRYKRKEKAKQQTAAGTTTPVASATPTPPATPPVAQKPVTNNVVGLKPFFNFSINLNNRFYEPAIFSQPVQQIQTNQQVQPIQINQPVQQIQQIQTNQQVQPIQINQPVQPIQPIQINQQVQPIQINQPVQQVQPIQINQQVQVNSITQNLNTPQIGGIQTIGSRAINNNAPFFTAQINTTQFNNSAVNNGGSLVNSTPSITKITSVHQFYQPITTNTTTVNSSVPPVNDANVTQKAAPTFATNPGANLNQPSSSASMNFNQIQTNNITNHIKPGNNFIPFNNAFHANSTTTNASGQSPNLMQVFPFNNFYNPSLFNQFTPKTSNNPQNGKK